MRGERDTGTSEGGRTCEGSRGLASPLCSAKTLDLRLLRGASPAVCSWSADVLRIGNGSLAMAAVFLELERVGGGPREG